MVSIEAAAPATARPWRSEIKATLALSWPMVLTNLAPARDAASHWLVHRLDEQPVGLIGTPQRVGPGPWDLRDLLATQPLILPTRETALRSAFDALLARLGVAPVLAAEVDDMVRLVPGTWLAELLGLEEIPVNSLHGQGIKTLGKGLEALAHAEDGVIEAIHLPQAPQFTLGVQWHPEWQAAQNPQSVRLFQAFGAACRKRVAEQNG